MDSEGDVPLPLQSVMDILANLYNTGAQAEGTAWARCTCARVQAFSTRQAHR